MNWDQYLEFTNTTAQYPQEPLNGLVYVALKLVGESGEFLQDRSLDELGDICWYVAQLHKILEISPEVNWQYAATNEEFYLYFASDDVFWMVSQISELVGKMLRRGIKPGDEQRLQNLAGSLIAWIYVTCKENEWAIERVFELNVEKLTKRVAEDVIKDETKR